MATVNMFFNVQKNSMQWAGSITKSQSFAPAKAGLAQTFAGYPAPPGFDKLLIMKLGNGLEIDIGDILVGAWRKRGEIVQYRDKENPPSGSHLVPLVEHTVVSEHHPTIQAMIGQVQFPSIEFDVVLKLKMQGAILAIRDGKIMEVSTGTCTGSGSVGVAGCTFLERETSPFELPGTITFREGIEI